MVEGIRSEPNRSGSQPRASPVRLFFKVIAASILPGVVAGGVFTFLLSAKS
jgi:ABC-type spermidine/putrescine transport system permease subunit II